MDRLEQILVMLAQQYAPQLLPVWSRQGDPQQRVALWARQLADNNILVLTGDFPYSLQSLGQDVNSFIQAWVNGYGQFYYLLSRSLFPSYTYLSAHYTDEKWPTVIYLQGAATPVIQRMAGYIAPYIVERQFEKMVSEAELIGVMDLVLDELEAGGMERTVYRQIRDEGVSILKQMLAAQIRQLSLTNFDREIFTDSQRIVLPGMLPPLPQPPPAPARVPEEDSQLVRVAPPRRADTGPLTPTQSMDTQPPAPQTTNGDSDAERPFGSSIPVFFSRNRDTGKKRRPPVPPMPDDLKR